MPEDRGKGSNFVAGLMLFGIGCISIGFALAKIVNDLDGGAPLAGVGAMCAALAAVLLSRDQKPD